MGGGIIQTAEGLPLLDPKTKAKPENLARDYGDKFLAADGFAQTYPEHKYLIVEGLRELGYRVGMTGDGVNDSPALKRADVGIAVFGATDAAKAAADIVLTEAGLSTIVEGILISRRIWCRVRSFLTYRFLLPTQRVHAQELAERSRIHGHAGVASVLPHAGADAHAHPPVERRHPYHHWIRSRGCAQDSSKVEHALPLLHGIRPVLRGDDFLRQSALYSSPQLG